MTGRWAIFADFRGVLYCEPVNEFMHIYRKYIPFRAAITTWRGKLLQAERAAAYAQHVVFLAPRYREESIIGFVEKQTIPDGYVFCPDIAYMEENRWGPVTVLKWIAADNPRGPLLQREFRLASPEGHATSKGRDNNAVPRPITEQILSILS